jgi:hypothetical protein
MIVTGAMIMKETLITAVTTAMILIGSSDEKPSLEKCSKKAVNLNVE